MNRLKTLTAALTFILASTVANGSDDPLMRTCPRGLPASVPQAIATIQRPTTLPNRCSAVVHVPFVSYSCDPHGAINPLGASVGWAQVDVVFDLEDDLCVAHALVAGSYTAPTAVNHGTFRAFGRIDVWQ